MNLNNDEQMVLDAWEEIYKKSQLTLWVLLALKDGSKYISDVAEFIAESTEGKLSVDDKSMYRAIRRFTESGLVASSLEPSASGPSRKLMSLTKEGQRILEHFVYRNITSIVNNPKNKHLFT